MIWCAPMKIYPDKIILDNCPPIESKIYYVSGNEETLVSKICETLTLYFKNKNYKNIVKTESKKIDKSLHSDLGPSLFAEKTLTFHRRIKDVDLEYLDGLNLENEIIIISQVGKANTKLKRYFDNHKSFCSIACYALMRENKKKLIDGFFSNKNIMLKNEAYWYFLENSSNEYQLLENELEKIEIYNDHNLSIENIKKLTSSDKNEGLDVLFFSLLLPKNKLLAIAKKTIMTPSDAYSFLYRVGFYTDILSQSTSSQIAEENLPRYLFKEKDKFKTMFNNTSDEKISNIFLLLKKSELLIRKNGNLFLLISERFLLNLKKQVS